MKIPPVKVLFATLAFGAAFAGISGQVAFGWALLGDPQQASSVNVPPDAGPNRPANVPDGYVITPFGYFHPSCVQSLSKGERVLTDGRVQHADGSTEDTAAVCSYPHFLAKGMPGSASAVAKSGAQANTPPELSGWVESASISTTGSTTTSYGSMIATWKVPAAPPDNGQVLFFFPGFEDIDNVQSILQPVMQFYIGSWTIASWNCCLNGITTSSPAVNITAGDEIHGSITSTCSAGTLSCATWNVLTLDLTTGESTTLEDTPSDGQTFNWAFGGVLEADSITSCDDYPPDRQLTFDNLTVFDQNLHPVFNPKWTIALDTGATPQCDYGIKLKPHEVTVHY